MTVERAVERVLDRLSDTQVEALAVRCESSEAPWSFSLPGSQPGAGEAVAQLGAAGAQQPGLTGAGLALALRCGLRARRAVAECASRPVWTGPGATGEQRLTAAQITALIGQASERVLVVSFAAYTLRAVSEALAGAAGRGCVVDAVFETSHDSAGAYEGPSEPYAAVDGLRRWRWPEAKRPESGAVLHAKLLVVDGRRALIGSANLTQRALHQNLEAGVLVRDPAVAAALELHVRRLMADGTLVRA